MRSKQRKLCMCYYDLETQCKKFSVLYMSELDAEDIVMKKETMAPFFWKLLLITN